MEEAASLEDAEILLNREARKLDLTMEQGTLDVFAVAGDGKDGLLALFLKNPVAATAPYFLPATATESPHVTLAFSLR